MDNKAIIAQEYLRASIYDALRSFYNLGPQVETLKTLKEIIEKVENQTEIAELNEGLNLLKSFYETNYDLEKQQVEFTALLVGPGKTIIIPYESAYEGEGKPSLMQESTIKVRKIYIEAGLMMEKFQSQPEDHIAAELEFMYYLCKKSLVCLQQDDENQYMKMVEFQQRFLQEHLQKWVYQFAEKLYQQATSDLIKGVAKVTTGIIKTDLMIFSQELN